MNYSKHNNDKRLRRHKSHGKKVKNKIGFVILRVVAASLMIAVLAGGAAGIGAYLSIIQGAPPLYNLSHDLLEGSFDSVILDAHGNELVRLEGGVNRAFAAWDEIPEHLWQAFVAIEDERFFEHNGIDTRGMFRAVYQTLMHSNTQGASTITQQLVKNLLGVRRNTMETKLQEQYLAIQFEAMLVEELGSIEKAKQHILHLYLNIIYLGGGNEGVMAASWFYFNKCVSELTLSESAVIAAITQWPWQHNPIRFPEYNRIRQINVLDSMLRLGYITEAEHTFAINDDPFARIMRVAEDVHPTRDVNIFFVDAVIDALEAQLREMGMSNQEVNHLIFHGGLTVHATMDPRVQDIVDDVFLSEEMFPTNPQDFEYHLTFIATVYNSVTGARLRRERTSVDWGVRVQNEDQFDAFIEWAIRDMTGMAEEVVTYTFFSTPQPQSSMVILNHNNGHVLAMAGQRGEKQTNRGLNRATNSRRQPGSVFKIFASYAPAFDLGLITAATTYDDAPNIILENDVYRVWPQNWWTREAFPFRGYTSVRRAIELSYNVVAVHNINALTPQVAHNYLLNFGFTTISDAEAGNPAMALGGLTHGVTNIELTGAMGAIANGGILHPSILFTRVYDRHGNILIDNTVLPPTQVMNRNAAYILMDTMRDVVRTGTGGGARFSNLPGMDNAGKTGTTQLGRDLYYTGSTPHLTASVWVGHDQPRTLTGNVTSSRPDTRIWGHVMERVHHALELEPLRFERPAGFTQVQICSVSGRLPVSGLCDHDPRGGRIRTELFAPGTAPTSHCHIHRRVEVSATCGGLATAWTPAHYVVSRVGIVRDRSWMEVAGNVPIRDAAYEIPTQSCACNHSNFHTGGHGYDGYGHDDYDEDWLNWFLNWGGLHGGQTDDDDDDNIGGPGGLLLIDDDDDDEQGHEQNSISNTPMPTPTPVPTPDRTPITIPESTQTPNNPVTPSPSPSPMPSPGTGPNIGVPGA